MGKFENSYPRGTQLPDHQQWFRAIQTQLLNISPLYAEREFDGLAGDRGGYQLSPLGLLLARRSRVINRRSPALSINQGSVGTAQVSAAVRQRDEQYLEWSCQ